MAAYVLADITILDPEVYEDYRRQVRLSSRSKAATRRRTRGVRGDWQPNRLIVLAFPDMDALRRWYQSDDYQALLRIRHRGARSNLIAVEGV